jgi:hypothetical protein
VRDHRFADHHDAGNARRAFHEVVRTADQRLQPRRDPRGRDVGIRLEFFVEELVDVVDDALAESACDTRGDQQFGIVDVYEVVAVEHGAERADVPRQPVEAVAAEFPKRHHAHA